MTTNGKDRIIEKWRRILGLRGWRLRHRPEPPPLPSKNSAFSEYDFAQKIGEIWGETEAQILHEELHMLLSALDDAWFRAVRTKRLDSLWKRRMEDAVKRLEKAIRRVGRGA